MEGPRLAPHREHVRDVRGEVPSNALDRGLRAEEGREGVDNLSDFEDADFEAPWTSRLFCFARGARLYQIIRWVGKLNCRRLS